MSDSPLPDVCLVMIVRDEAHVIERCLRSVRPLIRRWCIVDTGSTDDTAERIEASLRDVPGQLHHRPWLDFGHNRSEAMALARGQGDWLLLIDADEELHIEPGFCIPERPEIEAWQILQRPGGSANEFYLPRLLRADLPWRFEGVLHEYLACDRDFEQAVIPGLSQTGHFDSARNQQPQRQKYLKDADVLRRALKQSPDHARYQFYLAQSLRDAGEREAAILAYRRRAGMAGWDEERFCALLEVARLLELTGAPHAELLAAYLGAWNARPQRAEPLVELARLHRQREEYALAQLFASRAVSLPRPDDILFLDAGVYQWRARDELAVASYWVGDPVTAVELARGLLESGLLPEGERERVRDNLRFFEQAAGRRPG
ncbi:tetratricopeptide repeat-containing glycosyltransferase [Wenzhouxiangella marina]|uniref:Glycosyl transferase family 2 n=1 Tax=Wenzhouxiangella marina TaxID=1579979 RepID=A0A0K0XUA6_9GAMM|nr:glycosyltransferase family 2 protein [Wenzhouxiangella marina]AKS41245.1 Glycosyl transferase family 2 [Wenzhouxiangella marina]MBB6088125.1 tetratricopeptide (TPR) repeat protein [Wenzhouxiangella marina]